MEMDRDQGALWFRSPRHTTENGQGWPVKIELQNGNLQILAWTDKHHEETMKGLNPNLTVPFLLEGEGETNDLVP